MLAESGGLEPSKLHGLNVATLPFAHLRVNWCSDADSNRDCRRPQRRPSTDWGTRAVWTAGLEPARVGDFKSPCSAVRDEPTPTNWSPRGVLTSHLLVESQVSRPLDDGALWLRTRESNPELPVSETGGGAILESAKLEPAARDRTGDIPLTGWALYR